MNVTEVSLEILKIVISKESFDGKSLPERTEKVLEVFREIYSQVSLMKAYEETESGPRTNTFPGGGTDGGSGGKGGNKGGNGSPEGSGNQKSEEN